MYKSGESCLQLPDSAVLVQATHIGICFIIDHLHAQGNSKQQNLKNNVFQCKYTVFRRINAPGDEAQNEPLPFPDLNETECVPPWVP